MMEFCPKCGAVLIQKAKNAGCPRCNYSAKGKLKIKTFEKIDFKKQEAAVSKKEEQIFPVITEKCKKCKNEKAYFWTVQTRAADEAETKFFKCTECGHTHKSYR